MRIEHDLARLGCSEHLDIACSCLEWSLSGRNFTTQRHDLGRRSLWGCYLPCLASGAPMTLIDAIKSGKWFGLGGEQGYPFKGQPDGRVAGPDGYIERWVTSAVLRDDWEIQEPTVTISRSQFWDAYKVAVSAAEAHFPRGADQFYTQAEFVMSTMADRLGLEGP